MVFAVRFGDKAVTGTWMSSTEVLCSSPLHVAGRVYVEIAPSTEDTYSNDLV